MEATLISKEQVGNCIFHYTSNNEHVIEKLKKAMVLGNNFKLKSKIFFNTSEGLKAVETTVWSVSENHVLLKGDIVIPLNAIVQVEI
jgi:hypothetical protein